MIDAIRPVLFRSVLAIAAALAFVPRGLGDNSLEELMRQGDFYYERLQPAEALKYYLPAEKADPKNPRLLVKIARQYRHLMSESVSKEDKLQDGATAVAYAERAKALAPNDPETQLAVAISYGKLLPLEGAKQQVENSCIIKASAEKAIALDPTNDLAWQVMGRWYLVLAEVGRFKRALAEAIYGALPPAKYEDAARCFEKAIKLNPNRLMHYIELGRTYAGMGRDSEARQLIAKGLAMPNTEKDDPETKDQGRKLLAKLH